MCQNWNCTEGYWKCADNLHCIKEEYVCDGEVGWRGCPDGSDEADCKERGCAEGMWMCRDYEKCIDIRLVCNSRTDCYDLSDESPDLCANWTCPDKYWKCKDNSKCIEETKILNHINSPDCPDGSDENPDFHIGRTCPDGYFTCNNSIQCVGTVICLIEAPGAIARLNLIPWSKSWGSELSNGGFGLKIGQILRKLSLF